MYAVPRTAQAICCRSLKKIHSHSQSLQEDRAKQQFYCVATYTSKIFGSSTKKNGQIPKLCTIQILRRTLGLQQWLTICLAIPVTSKAFSKSMSHLRSSLKVVTSVDCLALFLLREAWRPCQSQQVGNVLLFVRML